MANQSADTIEVRCKRPDCPLVRRCPANGKLLAKVKGLPRDLRGRGLTVELPCPHRKSVILNFPL